MDIGIGLPNPIPGTSGKTLLECARRAEERGFSSLATIDRVAYPSYESLIALAAAAAVTERIGLMTNILLAPTRNPVLLAKEAASVDQISGGRLTLGLGVGGREDDFTASGQSFAGRGRIFEKQLEILHDAWKGSLVAGANNPTTPHPARDSSIPILIGGHVDQAIERAAKWGVGWTAGGAAPDQVAALVEKVLAAWKRAGRSGKPRIVALTYFALGDRADRKDVYIKDYYGFLGDFAEQMASYVPATVEALTGVVKLFQDAGVDEVILDPTIAEVDQVDMAADAVL
jgi:alkanesulfonate monooxygenase SsuD/methylene tetrahydromethanopterin reductase-like flavin-dependent oxidoreductase (luciferase family)